MTEEIIRRSKADLERMRDDLARRVELETTEFNRLFARLSTKDCSVHAQEEFDEVTAALREVTQRERLRRIAATARSGGPAAGIMAAMSAFQLPVGQR
ncbi:MAG: hypothetical protein ACLFO1_10535 [Spirochaetaceae bacterium]